MDRQLSDYEEEFRTIGVEAFRSRYTAPMLLSLDQTPEEDSVTFETGFGGPTAIARPITEEDVGSGGLPFDPERSDELRFTPMGGHMDLGRQPLFALQKRADAPPPERIGIGRVPGVDVCIPLPRVSKYHAYFMGSGHDKELTLTDANSKNGTRVRGRLLSPDTPTPVYDGDEIRIGPYRFKLFFAESFVDLVARRVSSDPSPP